MSYHSVQFQINQTKCLQVIVQKPKYFGWAHAQNGQIDWNKFKSNLVLVVSYHPVKLQIDRTKVFKLESGNQNVDGQTARYINLIVGLVKCNLPNSGKKLHWACAELLSFFHCPVKKHTDPWNSWSEGRNKKVANTGPFFAQKGGDRKEPGNHSVKFEIDRRKHLQVRAHKGNFKMAAMSAILIFQMAPIFKSNLA